MLIMIFIGISIIIYTSIHFYLANQNWRPQKPLEVGVSLQSEISSSVDSSTPSSTSSLHNPWLKQIRFFYDYLFKCGSFAYITHFRQIGMGDRTAKNIIRVLQTIHSKQKICTEQDVLFTRVFFCDPTSVSITVDLLYPSGRRTIVQRIIAFYSLLESQHSSVYLSHFRKIQMNSYVSRRLLEIILLVQDQPPLIIKRLDRYTKIQLNPTSTSPSSGGNTE